MNLYCVYSNHLDDIKVKTLKVIRETEKHYIFKYDDDLQIDFVRKDLIDKMWDLNHQEGSAIIADNKMQIKTNIEIMVKGEMLKIKKKQSDLTVFKSKIKQIQREYICKNQ